MKISLSALFILCLLISCKEAPEKNKNVDRWQTHADNTTIIRDAYGVPHIKQTQMQFLDCYMHNARTILTV